MNKLPHRGRPFKYKDEFGNPPTKPPGELMIVARPTVPMMILNVSVFALISIILLGGWYRNTTKEGPGEYLLTQFLNGIINCDDYDCAKVYRDHFHQCKRLNPEYFSGFLRGVAGKARVKKASRVLEQDRRPSESEWAETEGYNEDHGDDEDDEADETYEASVMPPAKSPAKSQPAKRVQVKLPDPMPEVDGKMELFGAPLLTLDQMEGQGPDKQVHLQNEVVPLGSRTYAVYLDLPSSVDMKRCAAFRHKKCHNRLVFRYPKQVLSETNWVQWFLATGQWLCTFWIGGLITNLHVQFESGSALFEAVNNHVNKINEQKDQDTSNTTSWVYMTLDFNSDISATVKSIQEPSSRAEIHGLSFWQNQETKIAMIIIEEESNEAGFINNTYNQSNTALYGNR